MATHEVKTAFDLSADTYDQARKQLVPCFEDFYKTVLELIPHEPHDRFRVLDLGAGTGLLSFFIAKQYPEARITLMDISGAMLANARERFTHSPARIEFVQADYSKPLSGAFEVVVSALSIHHLADRLKGELFHRIYELLPESGIFINADQVKGSSPEIENTYREAWIRQVRNHGVSNRDLNAALERMKEDQMAPLEDQLNWLKEAGFGAVNCWYKNYSFVVYSGQKGIQPKTD